MNGYIMVLLGGGVGSVLRFLISTVIMTRTGSRFPLGTVFINITGSFLIGLLMTLLTERLSPNPNLRLLLVTGFLGGYTTFSSFGWESAKMFEAGEWLRASTYVLASVILGLLLSAAGIRLANRL